jgi:hypothetical protein
MRAFSHLIARMKGFDRESPKVRNRESDQVSCWSSSGFPTFGIFAIPLSLSAKHGALSLSSRNTMGADKVVIDGNAESSALRNRYRAVGVER